MNTDLSCRYIGPAEKENDECFNDTRSVAAAAWTSMRKGSGYCRVHSCGKEQEMEEPEGSDVHGKIFKPYSEVDKWKKV
jgi:hypothetical protein